MTHAHEPLMGDKRTYSGHVFRSCTKVRKAPHSGPIRRQSLGRFELVPDASIANRLRPPSTLSGDRRFERFARPRRNSVMAERQKSIPRTWRGSWAGASIWHPRGGPPQSKRAGTRIRLWSNLPPSPGLGTLQGAQEPPLQGAQQQPRHQPPNRRCQRAVVVKARRR